MGKGARNRGSHAKQSPTESHLPLKLAPEEQEILREIQESAPGIQRLPEAERIALVRSMSFKMHSGPLPCPEDLQAYDTLIPNGAERIMALTEKQAAHRMDIEKQVMKVAPRETARGQAFALFIGLAGLGTSAYIARLGMAGAAGTIATAALGTLAVGFLKSRNR